MTIDLVKSIGINLLVATATLGVANGQTSELCSCTDLDSTLAGFGALTQIDWQSVNRTRLAEAWPTLSCAPVSKGPFTQGEFTERCCQTCGTCGGQLVVEGVDPTLVRLQSIGVLVCRDTPDDAIRDLKTLVGHAVPESVDASYESARSDLSDNRYKIAYRWRVPAGTALLNGMVYPWDEKWVGTLTLTRCVPPETAEQWVFDDGSTLSITHTSVNETDRERWFNLSYLSECVLADQKCLLAEADKIWPRLKPLAQRENATAVSIEAEDCWTAVEAAVLYAIVHGEWMRLRD